MTSNKVNKDKQSSRPALRGQFAHEVATDPFLDWVLILAVSLLASLLLVGAGISVYLGTKAQLEAPVPSIGHPAPLPLDAASLDETLAAFAGRASEKMAIVRTFSAPIDPSLP